MPPVRPSSDDSTSSGSPATPSRKKPDRPGSVAINFKKGEEDDRDEFFRQLLLYAKQHGLERPNKSEFAKHLLLQSLYPDERPRLPTIQAILEDLQASTQQIEQRLEAMERQNKQLRNTVAESVGILLLKTANLSQEEVKEWLEKRLGVKKQPEGRLKG